MHLDFFTWKVKRFFKKGDTLSVFNMKARKTYPKAIIDTGYSDFGNVWYRLMSEIDMRLYYKQDELEKAIKAHVLENSPSAEDITVTYYNHGGFYKKNEVPKGSGVMKTEIYVRYKNGITVSDMYDGINNICEKHYSTIPQYENEHWHNDKKTINWCVMVSRGFSDDEILKVARKYADLMSEDLEINMKNIRLIQYGKATLYDLAVCDLEQTDL